jgi:hypothetical protein
MHELHVSAPAEIQAGRKAMDGGWPAACFKLVFVKVRSSYA